MVTLRTDVLVIGGGATGAGVAWDAALRGFDVVLADRKDLAEGTSGRFHGLLHSGGRYAVKDPRAAEECVAENRVLRNIAADTIEDTGGFFVTTPWDDPAYADRFAETVQDFAGQTLGRKGMVFFGRNIPIAARLYAFIVGDQEMSGQQLVNATI